jgi:hypothetical protein
MPFGFVTQEMLEAYWAQQGITPPTVEPAPPIVCGVCETELDDPSVELEAGPPLNRKRYYHIECLMMHLIREQDNPDDELTAFITREIPCTTAT